jgi:hypothetical protein
MPLPSLALPSPIVVDTTLVDPNATVKPALPSSTPSASPCPDFEPCPNGGWNWENQCYSKLIPALLEVSYACPAGSELRGNQCYTYVKDWKEGAQCNGVLQNITYEFTPQQSYTFVACFIVTEPIATRDFTCPEGMQLINSLPFVRFSQPQCAVVTTAAPQPSCLPCPSYEPCPMGGSYDGRGTCVDTTSVGVQDITLTCPLGGALSYDGRTCVSTLKPASNPDGTLLCGKPYLLSRTTVGPVCEYVYSASQPICRSKEYTVVFSVADQTYSCVRRYFAAPMLDCQLASTTVSVIDKTVAPMATACPTYAPCPAGTTLYKTRCIMDSIPKALPELVCPANTITKGDMCAETAPLTLEACTTGYTLQIIDGAQACVRDTKPVVIASEPCPEGYSLLQDTTSERCVLFGPMLPRLPCQMSTVPTRFIDIEFNATISIPAFDVNTAIKDNMFLCKLRKLGSIALTSYGAEGSVYVAAIEVELVKYAMELQAQKLVDCDALISETQRVATTEAMAVARLLSAKNVPVTVTYAGFVTEETAASMSSGSTNGFVQIAGAGTSPALSTQTQTFFGASSSVDDLGTTAAMNTGNYAESTPSSTAASGSSNTKTIIGAAIGGVVLLGAIAALIAVQQSRKAPAKAMPFGKKDTGIQYVDRVSMRNPVIGVQDARPDRVQSMALPHLTV